MKNSEIAKVFAEIADLLELKGENPYKVRAYRTVVRSLEELAVPVSELFAQNKLSEIPGAGEAIRAKITELVRTGHLKYYENLKAEFPEGIRELLAISGIGPRTAHTLYNDLGIKSITELEEVINSDKPIPHIGEKTKENIRRALTERKKA